MTPRPLRIVRRLACFVVLAAAAAGAMAAPPPPRLELVAEWNRLVFDLGDPVAEKAYDDQQLYRKVLLQGAKVDSRGRVYASTARWGGPEVPATLSRVVKRDGQWRLQPYPSREMNDLANPRGLKAVLGFEIDRDGVMWILDQGHVGGAPSQAGDEKLIAWHIRKNEEIARYEFTDADTDKACSFLNDLAVDNTHEVVYITDSGSLCHPLKGGLIVYDMKTKTAKRVLSAPEWVNDEAFTFQVQGRDVRKPKEGKPDPMRTGADGIALSGDKKTLYWTNLTGNRLLSLPTDVLRDFSKSEADVIAAATVVTTLPSNTDGMTSDRDGNLYMTALTLNGVTRRDATTGEVTTVVSDDAIAWPDTLAWGFGGWLYVVSNHLHLWADGDMDFDRPAVPNFRIHRMQVGGKPYTDR